MSFAASQSVKSLAAVKSPLSEARRCGHGAPIESGWIQINQGGGQVIGQSYGGYKASGIGREFSIEGAIESFTQIKQINVKIK
jgi:aldehyde dehydrogenase (NAD+)